MGEHLSERLILAATALLLSHSNLLSGPPFNTDDPEPVEYHHWHPEVVRINPKQQVPVLVHGDLEIFDSTQIFEYLEDLAPEPALWPRNVRGRARARRLELESDEVYFPHVIRLMGLQDQLDGDPARAAIAAATRY